MPPLHMPGPCFSPRVGEQASAHTFSPSASLLGATHRGLGAFWSEEGVISWVPGCPEVLGDLGVEEKVRGNGEAH